MNRWLVPLAVAFAFLLAGGVWLQGQTARGPDAPKEKRTVNSSGSATLRAKPDSARVFFSIQTVKPSVKDARTENSAKFNRITAALQSLKIDNLKMKTADVNIDPIYSRRGDEEHPPQITGYRVSYEFTVLLKNTDVKQLSTDAGRVMDVALESGANTVQRIAFFKENDSDLRREAMTKAVEAALANARALAAGAQVKIFETVSINGVPDYGPWGLGNDNVQQNVAPAGAGGGDETRLIAGELVITCRVNVTCTF